MMLTLQILLLEWFLEVCGRGGDNRIKRGLKAIQPAEMMSLASVNTVYFLQTANVLHRYILLCLERGMVMSHHFQNQRVQT